MVHYETVNVNFCDHGSMGRFSAAVPVLKTTEEPSNFLNTKNNDEN